MDIENIKESIKNWINYKNENFNRENDKKSSNMLQSLAVIFCMGLLLLSLGKFFIPAGDSKQNSSQNETLHFDLTKDQSYKQQLENQLSSMLSHVHGLKNVQVMITLENETETVPAFNSVVNEKTSEEKDNEGGVRTIIEKQTNNEAVILHKNGDEEPMVLRTQSPSITGALIVAEGITSSMVEQDIIKATSTVLGIPVYKIMVLPK